jgi:hypothetical protein
LLRSLHILKENIFDKLEDWLNPILFFFLIN